MDISKKSIKKLEKHYLNSAKKIYKSVIDESMSKYEKLKLRHKLAGTKWFRNAFLLYFWMLYPIVRIFFWIWDAISISTLFNFKSNLLENIKIDKYKANKIKNMDKSSRETNLDKWINDEHMVPFIGLEDQPDSNVSVIFLSSKNSVKINTKTVAGYKSPWAKTYFDNIKKSAYALSETSYMNDSRLINVNQKKIRGYLRKYIVSVEVKRIKGKVTYYCEDRTTVIPSMAFPKNRRINMLTKKSTRKSITKWMAYCLTWYHLHLNIELIMEQYKK